MRRGIFSLVILLAALLGCVWLSSCNGLEALLEDKMLFASDGNGGAVLVSVQGYYGKDAVIPQVSPNGEPVVGIGAEAEAKAILAKEMIDNGIVRK